MLSQAESNVVTLVKRFQEQKESFSLRSSGIPGEEIEASGIVIFLSAEIYFYVTLNPKGDGFQIYANPIHLMSQESASQLGGYGDCASFRILPTSSGYILSAFKVYLVNENESCPQ